MLGCANWRGVRLFRELSFFTLFVIQKVFCSVLRLFPIYCFWKPNRAFGVALHQRDLPYTGGLRELLQC
jgi:hypothetical protein